jgi:curli biogenesis system outer membrane secretion channel CsgG
MESPGGKTMKFRALLGAAICLCLISDANAQFGSLIKGMKDIAKPTDNNKSQSTKENAANPDASKNALAPFTGPKKRLAVMDVEIKVGAQPGTMQPVMPQQQNPSSISTTAVDIPLPPDFGQGLTEMLTTALFNTNRFILLERKAMGDIQAELQLAATGVMNPDTGGKPGNLLGAQIMIRGAVTEYKYKRDQTNARNNLIKGVDLHRTATNASLALDIRIFDAATGQILDSVRADGRANSSQNEVTVDVTKDAKVGKASFSSSPMGAAAREAIEKAVSFICERMASRPWEGAIADLETENDKVLLLYLNAGSRTGIRVGDTFEILRPGRPIINPDTKVVIGRTRDTILGQCKVDTVSEEISTALPIQGDHFQKGDMIRIASGAAK